MVGIDRVGIIGAGRIGKAMALIALRARRSVVLANNRGPETLADPATDLGKSLEAGVGKAANTLGADVLASDPHQAGGRRVILLSGDDADAKDCGGGLFESAGFSAIDLGYVDRG